MCVCVRETDRQRETNRQTERDRAPKCVTKSTTGRHFKIKILNVVFNFNLTSSSSTHRTI